MAKRRAVVPKEVPRPRAPRTGVRVEAVTSIEEVDFDRWADDYIASIANASNRTPTP